MCSPIYNPMVPFNMNISLRPGFMIFITGTPNGGRFSVNLMTGPQQHNDYAFHFNPRFDSENTVVRNSKLHGGWQTEERHSNGFPFMMYSQFEMIILCQPHQYKIAVNGRHFIEFKHRFGMECVSNLNIDGAVQIHQIRFDNEISQGPSAPTDIYSPSVPCTSVVPFNNIKGRRVTISGIPENRHPHRMGFDFETVGPSKNIFFHFNPRMNEGVIVRNSLQRGNWGKEERMLSVPFPFQYGVPYQLVFSIDQSSFRVELNGMLICTFAHRQRPLNQIRNLCVGGSTSISRITFA